VTWLTELRRLFLAGRLSGLLRTKFEFEVRWNPQFFDKFQNKLEEIAANAQWTRNAVSTNEKAPDFPKPSV
jgi:hypothetical protein